MHFDRLRYELCCRVHTHTHDTTHTHTRDTGRWEWQQPQTTVLWLNRNWHDSAGGQVQINVAGIAFSLISKLVRIPVIVQNEWISLAPNAVNSRRQRPTEDEVSLWTPSPLGFWRAPLATRTHFDNSNDQTAGTHLWNCCNGLTLLDWINNTATNKTGCAWIDNAF